MEAKKRKVPKEVFDFSEWALQDIVRAPLPPVASSDPPPVRWLGVQSLASIATGLDGKVLVCNAAKRDIRFALGYVEARRQETPIVMPLDAPRAVVNLFSKQLIPFDSDPGRQPRRQGHDLRGRSVPRGGPYPHPGLRALRAAAKGHGEVVLRSRRQ